MAPCGLAIRFVLRSRNTSERVIAEIGNSWNRKSRVSSSAGCQTPLANEFVARIGRARAPSISRQGHPKQAHCFYGKTQGSRTPQPRQGRPTPRGRTGWPEVLPSLPGLVSWVRSDHSPLKRWAILNSPCRDAEQLGHSRLSSNHKVRLVLGALLRGATPRSAKTTPRCGETVASDSRCLPSLQI